jgi:hypothetical protein
MQGIRMRIRHLEQESKAAREEISKLKAVNGSSSTVEQPNLNDWTKQKNSKSRCSRFSADDAFRVQLSSTMF